MARKPKELRPSAATQQTRTVIINGVPTQVRPLTEEEIACRSKWTQNHGFPECFRPQVERLLSNGGPADPREHLMALVDFAAAVSHRILTVRRDHAEGREERDPSVVVQNVMSRLRSARDYVLKHSPPAHMGVISSRLDRLLEATSTTLKAFMSEPIDKIHCNNPKCEIGGRHLFPGPWFDALMRGQDAQDDAFRLALFFDDSDRGPPARTLIVAVGNQEATPKNVLLARVRTAFVEAGGNVVEARRRLATDEDLPVNVKKSTFYNYLKALDKMLGTRWRAAAHSKELGILEAAEHSGRPEKYRGETGTR